MLTPGHPLLFQAHEPFLSQSARILAQDCPQLCGYRFQTPPLCETQRHISLHPALCSENPQKTQRSCPEASLVPEMWFYGERLPAHPRSSWWGGAPPTSRGLWASLSSPSGPISGLWQTNNTAPGAPLCRPSHSPFLPWSPRALILAKQAWVAPSIFHKVLPIFVYQTPCL